MIWKTVFDFENYKVSDEGQVENIKRGTILRTRVDKNGYEIINLYKNGRMTTMKIHRVVLKSFNPCDNSEDLLVNHKDGIKLNNKLNNLEWCTNLENSLHAVSMGLIKTMSIQGLDKNGQVVCEYSSLRSAEIDGYQHSNISSCISGKRKTHKGLTWREKEELI